MNEKSISKKLALIVIVTRTLTWIIYIVVLRVHVVVVGRHSVRVGRIRLIIVVVVLI